MQFPDHTSVTLTATGSALPERVVVNVNGRELALQNVRRLPDGSLVGELPGRDGTIVLPPKQRVPESMRPRNRAERRALARRAR
jgi:hypothetical protein